MQTEKEFSLKGYFIPITTKKIIHFLIIIGFIVFGNILINGFAWDDGSFILQNPLVHSINFWASIKENIFNTYGQYRPIPVLYFSVLYTLFTNSALFYHIVQLLMHIFNSVMVFLLFSKLLNKKTSFFISTIFLIHPLQVESVSFIGSSGNILFFLFGTAALLLSLKSSLSLKRITLISILLLMSLLSKETGALFLIQLLIYRQLFQKKKLILFIICDFIVILLYSVIRFRIAHVYSQKIQYVPIADMTLFQRLLNVPSICYYYIKTFIFPVNLATDQKWVITTININNFYFPLLVVSLFFLLIALIGMMVYFYNNKSFSTYVFFLLWFILGLGLHLQIFPLDMTVADRWFYFPIVGLLGILGICIDTVFRFKLNRMYYKAGISVGILVIIFLSIRTIYRNSDWYSNKTLLIHDTKIYTNADMENDLANEYALDHDYNNALVHYNKAVIMKPSETTYANIGYTYALMGNLEKAKTTYYKALTVPNYLQTAHKHTLLTYSRLGEVLLLTNDSNFFNFIRGALSDYSDSGHLWYLLSLAYYKENDLPKALVAAEKAKEFSPDQETNTVYYNITHNIPIHINTVVPNIK